MKDQKVLEDLIGNTLKDGLIQSFELHGSLINLVNVTILKFNFWIKIVVSEGEISVSTEKREIDDPSQIGDNDFKYPISKIEDKFPEFNKYIGKRLIGYKELVSKNEPALSFGVNLFFENNLNLIIFNPDYTTDENIFVFSNRIPDQLKEK